MGWQTSYHIDQNSVKQNSIQSNQGVEINDSMILLGKSRLYAELFSYFINGNKATNENINLFRHIRKSFYFHNIYSTAKPSFFYCAQRHYTKLYTSLFPANLFSQNKQLYMKVCFKNLKNSNDLNLR